MDSLKESCKPKLQLHVYLDKDSICIRSYVENDIPYFEIDAPYDCQAQKFLTALTDEEMDERLSPLFYGVNKDLMKSKIFCTINDYRSPLNSCRTFFFKSKRQENNHMSHSNEIQNFN